MMAYVRLHGLRLMRLPLGRSALLAALLLPPTLVIGLQVLALMAGGSTGLRHEAMAWGNSFLGMLVALGATGWIPASLLSDERTERRVSVLRAAGIDGRRVSFAMIILSAACAMLLTAAALATSAILAALGKLPWVVVVQQLIAGILIGLAMGAAGSALEVLVGRAGWAVVNAGCAVVGAASIAGLRTAGGDGRASDLMLLAGLAAIACASSVFILSLGPRLTRARVETWS